MSRKLTIQDGDLISRAAAVDILRARSEMAMGMPSIVFKASAQILEKLPSVDVEPVKHGRWIFDKDANDWGIGGYVCSECRAKNNNLPCVETMNPMMFVGSSFCPNCGAKMVEEEQHD